MGALMREQNLAAEIRSIAYSSEPADSFSDIILAAAKEIERLSNDRYRLLKTMRDVDDLVLAFTSNARSTLINGLRDD